MTRSPRASAGPHVLVVYKKSMYQLHVRERRSRRVRRLLRDGDPTVKNVLSAHEDHSEGIERTRLALKRLGARAEFLHREPAASVQYDLVVTLGGDGTLLRASHRVGSDVPMVAINTSPGNSVGYFCAGTKDTVESVLAHALAGTLRATQLTRMRIAVDGKTISSRILNDILFCHECPAATSRYLLSHRDVVEDQRSSGLWVGPAAGSTAAQRSAGGRVLPMRSKRLQFVVREPYAPPGTGYQLVRGLVEPGEELRIHSKMTAGRIFLDGPYREFRVPMGGEVLMERSDQPLTILGQRR